jgi:hypothetical protein
MVRYSKRHQFCTNVISTTLWVPLTPLADNPNIVVAQKMKNTKKDFFGVFFRFFIAMIE